MRAEILAVPETQDRARSDGSGRMIERLGEPDIVAAINPVERYGDCADQHDLPAAFPPEFGRRTGGSQPFFVATTCSSLPRPRLRAARDQRSKSAEGGPAAFQAGLRRVTSMDTMRTLAVHYRPPAEPQRHRALEQYARIGTYVQAQETVPCALTMSPCPWSLGTCPPSSPGSTAQQAYAALSRKVLRVSFNSDRDRRGSDKGARAQRASSVKIQSAFFHRKGATSSYFAARHDLRHIGWSAASSH